MPRYTSLISDDALISWGVPFAFLRAPSVLPLFLLTDITADHKKFYAPAVTLIDIYVELFYHISFL